jgi:hypothetical protein
MDFLLGLIVGLVVGGIASALSAKYLGFFQKQVTSVEKKV